MKLANCPLGDGHAGCKDLGRCMIRPDGGVVRGRELDDLVYAWAMTRFPHELHQARLDEIDLVLDRHDQLLGLEDLGALGREC